MQNAIAFADNDIVVVAWSYGHKLADCMGFALLAQACTGSAGDARCHRTAGADVRSDDAAAGGDGGVDFSNADQARRCRHQRGLATGGGHAVGHLDARVAEVLRIEAVWLAVEPMDMRAGAAPLLVSVVKVFGAAQVHHGYTRRYPPTVNSAAETEYAASAARAVAGEKSVELGCAPPMASEDFAFMLNAKPGAYIWLGVDGDRPSALFTTRSTTSTMTRSASVRPSGSSWSGNSYRRSAKPAFRRQCVWR